MKKIAPLVCFLGLLGLAPVVSSSQLESNLSNSSEDSAESLLEHSAPKHFIATFLEMADSEDQEGLNKVFESMALLISEELGRRGFTQTEVDALDKDQIDAILSDVFAEAHTWTIQDLHDAAAPARRLAMQFAEDEAIEKYPYLVEQKEKLERYNQLASSVSVTNVSRGFVDDADGYPQAYLQLKLVNKSTFTITHVEMDVIAFDGRPGRGVLFMKSKQPVKAGESALMQAFVDPTSMLGPPFVKANSADIGFKVKSYYTAKHGRIYEPEFTDDMAETLSLAERIIKAEQ